MIFLNSALWINIQKVIQNYFPKWINLVYPWKELNLLVEKVKEINTGQFISLIKELKKYLLDLLVGIKVLLVQNFHLFISLNPQKNLLLCMKKLIRLKKIIVFKK